MAEEKKIKYKVEGEIPKYKTGGATKKGETSCGVKRRGKYSYHCGICGSANVVWHGVRFCMKCGKEREFFTIEPPSWLFFFKLEKLCRLCTCKKRAVWEYKVAVCLDCRATESTLCPNCKRPHWYSWKNNKHLCRKCGYER